MILWINRVYKGLLLIIVCGLVILLGAVRIIGYTPYAITSGSMIPEYPVGSVVYVKGTLPEELAVGDDISFYINESVIATHRICEIDYENSQAHTYGINNKDSEGNHINDAEPVDFDKIVGRVEFAIPALGFIYISMTTLTGKIAVVALILILLAVSKLLNFSCNGKEKRNGKPKQRKQKN